MDKLKKIFHHDKGSPSQSPPPQSSSAQSSPAMNQGGMQSGSAPQTRSIGQSSVSGDDAEGVVLHTNIGDITIALYPETPKASTSSACARPSALYHS